MDLALVRAARQTYFFTLRFDKPDDPDSGTPLCNVRPLNLESDGTFIELRMAPGFLEAWQRAHRS